MSRYFVFSWFRLLFFLLFDTVYLFIILWTSVIHIFMPELAVIGVGMYATAMVMNRIFVYVLTKIEKKSPAPPWILGLIVTALIIFVLAVRVVGNLGYHIFIQDGNIPEYSFGQLNYVFYVVSLVISFVLSFKSQKRAIVSP